MNYASDNAIDGDYHNMPSRYMCDVLEDMRKMHKTRNYSGLLGSIEQMQVMAYRMEAALRDQKTIDEYDENAAECRHRLKELEKEKRVIGKEVVKLRDEKKSLEESIKKLKHTHKKETKGGTVCCNRNADQMPCDCGKPMLEVECIHCGGNHTGLCGPHNIG